MSDREKAQEICNLTHHEWEKTYYGYKCLNCGEFIPYGCEPWIPFNDTGDDELCAWCGLNPAYENSLCWDCLDG